MVSSNRVVQSHEALVVWLLYADKTFKGACYECSKSLSCGGKKREACLYFMPLKFAWIKMDWLFRKKVKYYLNYIIKSQRSQLSWLTEVLSALFQ